MGIEKTRGLLILFFNRYVFLMIRRIFRDLVERFIRWHCKHIQCWTADYKSCYARTVTFWFLFNFRKNTAKNITKFSLIVKKRNSPGSSIVNRDLWYYLHILSDEDSVWNSIGSSSFIRLYCVHLHQSTPNRTTTLEQQVVRLGSDDNLGMIFLKSNFSVKQDCAVFVAQKHSIFGKILVCHFLTKESRNQLWKSRSLIGISSNY